MPEFKRPKLTISFDPDDFGSRDAIISLLRAERKLLGCQEMVSTLRHLLKHSAYEAAEDLADEIRNILEEFADDISWDL